MLLLLKAWTLSFSMVGTVGSGGTGWQLHAEHCSRARARGLAEKKERSDPPGPGYG